MAPSMLALSYVLVVFLSRMRPRVFTRANLCGMKGEVTGARILLSLFPSFPLIRAPALVIQIGLDKAILQLVATSGNRCRRIVTLEKVAGSSPVGHPPRKARRRRAQRSQIVSPGIHYGALLMQSVTRCGANCPVVIGDSVRKRAPRR